MKCCRFQSLAVIALGLLWPAGCERSGPAHGCLDGDLGRFALASLEPLGNGGLACRATYRDPKGAEARVTLEPPAQGACDEHGKPAKFEKHMVFSEPLAHGVRICWTSRAAVVKISASGLLTPQGPVLRAYLHEYPSQVAQDLKGVEQDVADLKQASRQVPQDAAVHLKLARKYRKLGDTVMAAHEYHIAVEKDRSCHPCYLEMGSLYRQLRHWDLSIRALRKAAALKPADPVAWLALGDVAYDVKNRLEAIRGYTKALEASLTEADRARAQKRLAKLKDGEFMIQVLPGANTPDGGVTDSNALVP